MPKAIKKAVKKAKIEPKITIKAVKKTVKTRPVLAAQPKVKAKAVKTAKTAVKTSVKPKKPAVKAKTPTKVYKIKAKRTLKGKVVPLIEPKFLIDSDGDGLSDWEEVNVFKSDPYNADTDGDGVPDGEELKQGRNPATGQKMKDFFIPHAGNNYHPHALHPRRLIFHAVAAIAVKLVVVMFVASYPLLAWMTPDIAAGEGRKIIALTNELRSSLSLKALVESPKLNAAAAKKVEDMFINQYFAHVSPRGLDLEHFLALVGYRDYAVVGENLAMGYANAEEAMAAWKKSPTHYANIIDENYSQIGVGLAGGTYSDTDTVFMAQYFALPNTVEAEAAKPVVKVAPDKAVEAGQQAVLSEKTIAPKKVAVAPLLTPKQATITVDTPAGKPAEKVIKVEALLPSETQSAVASVQDTNIVLTPVVSDSPVYSEAAKPAETLWTGQIAVANAPATEATVVPPSIVATDKAGNTAQVMVSPESVKPQVTSLAAQYRLFKAHPNSGLGKIFDASATYFYILLGLMMCVLGLNIFINIRKQHPHVIMSGLGLIGLLIMLIVF